MRVGILGTGKMGAAIDDVVAEHGLKEVGAILELCRGRVL